MSYFTLLETLRGDLASGDYASVFGLLRGQPDGILSYPPFKDTVLGYCRADEDLPFRELAYSWEHFQSTLRPLKKEIVEPRLYDQALANLREVCAEDENSVQPEYDCEARPLTFRETLAARLESYFTSEDKEKLFNTYLDTCTAVAYKEGSTKFKIIPISSDLLGLEADFNEPFVRIDYDEIAGVELDRNEAVYNQLLTKDEVIKHPAWLAAVEGDERLLEEYSDLVFALLKEKYGKDKGMGFWLRSGVQEDQLRSVFVYNLNGYSSANGCYNFNSNTAFLRVSVAQDKTARGGLSE